MQYNVAQLLKEAIGSSRCYQIEEKYTETLRITDWVAGKVHMVRTHQGVLVNASLDVQATLTCGRCLEEFSCVSTLSIEEEFFPTIDLHSGRKLWPLPENEEGLRIDANHVLDLTETMRQYTIADMPMKPLCREDCLGLCSLCGVNLNQRDCDCNKSPGDPRWGILAGSLHPQKG